MNRGDGGVGMRQPQQQQTRPSFGRPPQPGAGGAQGVGWAPRFPGGGIKNDKKLLQKIYPQIWGFCNYFYTPKILGGFMLIFMHPKCGVSKAAWCYV
jgi:hypothetical protein